MSGKPKIGDIAKIYYKGGPVGEEPQDVCVEGEPLEVLIGSLTVPAAIEQALTEMEIGEERTIDIEAKHGFGPYVEKYAEWYPRNMLPNGYDLEVGSMLMWQSKDGGPKVPARITDAKQDVVRVDLNHPMAGHDLSYWVKLVDFE